MSTTTRTRTPEQYLEGLRDGTVRAEDCDQGQSEKNPNWTPHDSALPAKIRHVGGDPPRATCQQGTGIVSTIGVKRERWLFAAAEA